MLTLSGARDFLRKSPRTTCKRKIRLHIQASLCALGFFFQYREWDLNPQNRGLLGLCLNRILADVGCGYIVSTHLGASLSST